MQQTLRDGSSGFLFLSGGSASFWPFNSFDELKWVFDSDAIYIFIFLYKFWVVEFKDCEIGFWMEDERSRVFLGLFSYGSGNCEAF